MSEDPQQDVHQIAKLHIVLTKQDLECLIGGGEIILPGARIVRIVLAGADIEQIANIV